MMDAGIYLAHLVEEVGTNAECNILGMMLEYLIFDVSYEISSHTHVKMMHKLLQVCKQVVTNLFTSCRQVVFALFVPSCSNKFEQAVRNL
jgi:hypothetical protein